MDDSLIEQYDYFDSDEQYGCFEEPEQDRYADLYALEAESCEITEDELMNFDWDACFDEDDEDGDDLEEWW